MSTVGMLFTVFLWKCYRKSQRCRGYSSPCTQVVRLPLAPRRRYVTRADLRKCGVTIGCAAVQRVLTLLFVTMKEANDKGAQFRLDSFTYKAQRPPWQKRWKVRNRSFGLFASDGRNFLSQMKVSTMWRCCARLRIMRAVRSCKDFYTKKSSVRWL